MTIRSKQKRIEVARLRRLRQRYPSTFSPRLRWRIYRAISYDFCRQEENQIMNGIGAPLLPQDEVKWCFFLGVPYDPALAGAPDGL